jgi:hypothetical protein
MRVTRYLLVLAAPLFVSQGVLAKDDGFYIGASIGSATVKQKGSDPDLGDFDIDDDNFAWKIFGGYQFNGVFAVEGGYRDLGDPSSSFAETELDAWDIYGIAGIPIGPIRAFGKVGGIYWDSDTKLEGGAGSGDDGFEFGAGAGLEFELGSVGIRGEIEYFDILDDSWMYTVGATITF